MGLVASLEREAQGAVRGRVVREDLRESIDCPSSLEGASSTLLGTGATADIAESRVALHSAVWSTWWA